MRRKASGASRNDIDSPPPEIVIHKFVFLFDLMRRAMLSVSTDYTAFDELRAISFPRIFLLGLTGHWTTKNA